MSREALDAAAALEAASAALGAKFTYAGAGVAGVGWALSNEFFGLAGLAVAVVGLLLQWHYKRKADRRFEKEHALRCARLQRGLAVFSEREDLDE